MIRRPPRSTLSSSSAASDVYKRQHQHSLKVSYFTFVAYTFGMVYSLLQFLYILIDFLPVYLVPISNERSCGLVSKVFIDCYLSFKISLSALLPCCTPVRSLHPLRLCHRTLSTQLFPFLLLFSLWRSLSLTSHIL